MPSPVAPLHLSQPGPVCEVLSCLHNARWGRFAFLNRKWWWDPALCFVFASVPKAKAGLQDNSCLGCIVNNIYKYAFAS